MGGTTDYRAEQAFVQRHYVHMPLPNTAPRIMVTLISLDHVQQLADQLSPLDQVRLIEHLARQIALALATLDTPAQSDREDAWAQLAQLREEPAALSADRLADEQLPAVAEP